MGRNSDKNWTLLICVALTLATVAVFWQVWTYDFISFDDPVYVYDNLKIQTGITLKAVKWAFTTVYANFWLPLIWLSYMLDWELFGSNPAGYHLTNLVFHIANTLLLFIVLRQMTGVLWRSAFVAALFALHPLHVESVAWVTERKDVLSTFFWMLTMAAYLGYAKHPGAARYLLMLLTFALGLMAKPMLVTLPFVFLLLDYWPLDRLGPKWSKAGRKYSFVYLLIEKIPLFVMASALSIVTFIAQKKGGLIPPAEEYSISVRLANASISYLQYIIRMVWPVRLAFFYPHPGQNVSVLYAVISAILLLVVTILVIQFATNHRYLVTGWFWYVGTLVPVIGLIQVGDQALADRFSYITLIGLFIIIAWELPELFGKWRHRKVALWTSSLIALSVLAVLAHLQQRCWENSITLGQHALKVTDRNCNYKAYLIIANMLCEQGRFEEAIRYSAEAVRISPNYVGAINTLGAALYKAGRIDEAIDCYQRALEIDPSEAMPHANLALALVAKGEFAEAVRYCKIALTTMDTITIHNTLGYALLNLGRFEEAAAEYRKVLSAMPNDPDILNKLGYALAQSGKFDEAISFCNKALQIAPDLVKVRLNLGVALVNGGRFAEAVKEYEKVLLVQPQNVIAHNDLGVALLRQGKFDEAIAHFNRAVQIDPNNPDSRNNLNIALAEKQKLRNKDTENTKE
jgi:Flp pilus assembly protein TadD